jgi:hypothetical protein
LGVHTTNVGVHWATLELLHLWVISHHWHLHPTKMIHVHHGIELLLLLVLKELLSLSIVHASSHPWVCLLQGSLVLRVGALKV